MKMMSSVLAFAGLVAVVTATPAAAGECRVACTRAKQVCVTAIKQAKAACRQECANARDGGAPADAFPGCLAGCRDDFASAKTTCKAALVDCRAACLPGGGGGDPTCADQCGLTGRDCLQTVRDGSLACGSTCQTTAQAAAATCRASANPFMCLLEVGRTLARCLGGCAESGITSAGACTTDLRTCLQGCGVGSPSAALLD